MAVTDLQAWADDLEIIRLPAIEADIDLLQSETTANTTLLNQTIQTYGDLFDQHDVRITTADTAADTADAKAVTAQSGLVQVDLDATTYTNNRIQYLKDYIDGLLLTKTAEIIDANANYTDGQINTILPDIEAMAAAKAAEANATLLTMQNVYADMELITDTLLDTKIPQLELATTTLTNDLASTETAFQALITDFNYDSLNLRFADVTGEIFTEITALQSIIEDPDGDSVGAGLRTFELTQADENSAFAAQIDSLVAASGGPSFVFLAGEGCLDAWTLDHNTKTPGQCASVTYATGGGWQKSFGDLRLSVKPAPTGTDTPYVYSKAAITCVENDTLSGTVSLEYLPTRQSALQAISIGLVWLDSAYNELSVTNTRYDLTTSLNQEFPVAGVAPAGAAFCRLRLRVRAVFSGTIPDGIEFYAAVIENVSRSKGLEASIDEVRLVNVDAETGTAFATIMRSLGATANPDGSTDLVTVNERLGTLAKLDGTKEAFYGLKADVGAGSAELQLVAIDDPDTGVSTSAKIRANTLLFEGSVTMKELAITEGWGNMLNNGAFVEGDLRGWEEATTPYSAADIVTQDDASGITAISTMPTSRALALAHTKVDQTQYIQTFKCAPGEKYHLQFDHAMFGGTNRNFWPQMRVRYEAADGTYISTKYVHPLAATDSTPAWQTWGEDFTVPGDRTVAPYPAKMIIMVNRKQSTIPANDNQLGYMTNMILHKKRGAGVFIDPDSITAPLINTESLRVAGLSVFGGYLESGNYDEDVAGWRISSVTGDAEFNDLNVRGVLTVGGKLVTGHLGSNSVTDSVYVEANGALTADTNYCYRTVSWANGEKLVYFLRAQLSGVIITPTGSCDVRVQIRQGGVWTTIATYTLDAPSDELFTMGDVPGSYYDTAPGALRLSVIDDGNNIYIFVALLSMILKR